MNLFFRILIALQAVVCWLISPFVRCRSKRPYSIPKIKNNILKCSATVLAKKIRNKEITCLEVTKAYIDRIQEVNPYINAVVENRFAGALEDAKNVDKIIATDELEQDQLINKYPLFGVPVTIKESCSLKGLSYCVGSKKRIGVKANEDGEAVRKLKEAGAIPLLVSTTSELCSSWETANLVTGRTLSPYNRNYTSGGSSGGEGALLGSGASVIGLGSDVAGSIRLPAMFNGVFGHKPTPRSVSISGHYPTSTDKEILDYLILGPMTRYAEDLRLMMNILAVDKKELKLDEKIDLSKLNVFFTCKAEENSFVLPNIDKDIKQIMKNCLNYLKLNCKSTISDYKFDMTESCEMSGTLLYKLEDIPNVLKNPHTGKVDKNLYSELFKAIFGCSNYSLLGLYFNFLHSTNIFVPRSKYNYFAEKAMKLKNDFIEKLGNSGVFLYPTFPFSGLRHGHILLQTNCVMYTMVFNALGLPATHVTLGKSRDGLPIGIQVIAAPYQDRLCLAVAEELEKYFGGWTEP